MNTAPLDAAAHPAVPHNRTAAGSTSTAGTGTDNPTPQSTGSATADPRLGWTATADDEPPALRQRRDGILPAIAAALSVRGQTLTCTASKADQPPRAHALVQDFLDTLTTERRERHTGRCAETVLLSRYLTATEDERAGKGNDNGKRGKQNKRNKGKPAKPLTHSEAKRALKHAKITARHIREDGDPLHGTYAAPCRSCTALLHHFGVRTVDPGPTPGHQRDHQQEGTR